MFYRSVHRDEGERGRVDEEPSSWRRGGEGGAAQPSERDGARPAEVGGWRAREKTRYGSISVWVYVVAPSVAMSVSNEISGLMKSLVSFHLLV